MKLLDIEEVAKIFDSIQLDDFYYTEDVVKGIIGGAKAQHRQDVRDFMGWLEEYGETVVEGGTADTVYWGIPIKVYKAFEQLVGV